MRKLTIREEQPGDIASIHALTRAAFAKAKQSDGNEQDIIDALRADGDLTLSLVATNMDEAIVGHIAFSPVAISDGTKGWYGAGPVSVMPTRQRTGIGSELAEDGIERLRKIGAKGIVLLGDPGYYDRFGFSCDPDLFLRDAPPEYFQVRALTDEPRPKGEVTSAPGFAAQSKG